jgi:3-oxoacyl-(acyl-carrier-protein) synthase
MSLACKLPGNVWDPDGYWNVVGNGVDCLLMIPYTRWDVDIYFSSNADAMPPGKCYCKHFGILTYEQMSEFDNEFFGMNLDESQKIEPPARNILEVGYECLFRAGYTRERLRGVELGCCYGFAAAELSQNYIQGHFGFEAETQTLTNSGICGARLHYVYGMKGPAATVETACSSSLYATAIVHSQLRPQMPSGGASRASSCRIQVEQGMAAGSNGYFDPWFTMSLCSAHMLSTTGRCYTFNSSADGYARGEGCPTMYYRRGRGEDPARLAVICGSCMNQDGRSASMTAPNGPSQQECIRHSLREAGIVALDIQIQELHGTGTSLGDPIEVGALRATMMTVDGEVREHPLVKTSSKSNVGHTELAAGICGIMKCVLMGIKCASSPNCHLKLLNPHIDSNSYPVYFGSEFVDQGRNEGFHGVSSFGFSGCNARGDIWARAMGGPRNTMPGKPPIDFSPARIFTCRALFSSNSQPPYAKEVEEIEGLDPVLNDAYLTETPHDDDNTFYCRGTFTGRTMEPMVWQEESNAYCFAFTMGETRIEQFHIIVNKNTNYTIFPATKMAGEDALTLGPGIAPTAHKWKIDGFKAGIKQGTVCAIKFIWDEATRQKKIVWGPCDEDWALDMAAESSFRHGFSLVCSCNADKPTSFAQVKGKPGLYEATFRIGLSGFEDFSLMRDADPLQAIYPPGQGVTTAGVPICGPDHLGDNKKKWRAIGSTGERAVVQLQVTDGTISMTMRSQASGVLTWSNEDALGHYYVTASWNNWSFTPMVPDPSNSSIYRLSAAITQERLESFQIVVDQDKRQALHPEMQMADSGQSPVCGPDGKGGHLQFGIFGAPGQAFEITLDLSQEDKRNIVTWTEASSAALKDS